MSSRCSCTHYKSFFYPPVEHRYEKDPKLLNKNSAQLDCYLAQSEMLTDVIERFAHSTRPQRSECSGNQIILTFPHGSFVDAAIYAD